MDDSSFLSVLFAPATPLYIGVLILGAATMRVVPNILAWLNDRRRLGAEIASGEAGRLMAEIKRLDDRCDHLQTEVDECRKREGEWMSRAITAEATLMGKGDAAQEAARIVATDRADPTKAPTTLERMKGRKRP